MEWNRLFCGGYKRLSKHVEDGRNQIEMVALDQLVPEDHLVRKFEQANDFEFIYVLVKDKLFSAKPFLPLLKKASLLLQIISSFQLVDCR
ncbi:hypothetical protein ACIGEL_18610 [Rossellomorea aquimaris]|uniref:hypothetical protein n=1 Tax=Rossellomorea aquimaris TaxID=189382 RepID=UPI0037C7F74B